MNLDAVVMGGSSGGIAAITAIVEQLSADFPIPVIVVMHIHKSDRGGFRAHLESLTSMQVKEAQDKQPTEPGAIYTAPADYHLLIERDGTLSLSVDSRVNCSRPSINVLFESAARAFGDRVAGVILSGSNDDGADGMRLIREVGGLCIAQDPLTAESPFMPQAAIRQAKIDMILPPKEIGLFIAQLGGEERNGN